MVKSKKYDYRKAVELLNQTIQKYNESFDLKGYRNNDVEIFWNIFDISLYYFNNFAYIYMVVKSTENAYCWNGNKYFIITIST